MVLELKIIIKYTCIEKALNKGLNENLRAETSLRYKGITPYRASTNKRAYFLESFKLNVLILAWKLAESKFSYNFSPSVAFACLEQFLAQK